MTAVATTGTFIDEAAIGEAMRSAATKDAGRVREILAKARELDGLAMDEVAVLSSVSDPELLAELFATARECKEAIYGQRLVLFAPLYISNLCNNDCLYCAFRVRNKELHRRALTQAEIRHEVELLVDQGHKRILLVAGESYPKDGGFQYVLDSIATIYDVKRGNGEIRRVNVNVAPLSVDKFRELKTSGIGTFQLFQETYHRATYQAVHVGGKKKDFDWRVTGMHRAMEAGIDDVGIGVLFGLADWRYEILAMLQHIHELERAYGVGPHTISVPRLEPASGSDMASHPPQPVSDVDFRKLVAILRLAVPYTGMILSTRETANLRQRDVRPGHQPDQRRQPDQPRRLRGERGVRRGAVPARRPPLPRRGHPRHLRARLRPQLLHGLLPPGPHGHGLHGPRQAGRHQAPLRPQRAQHVRGVPHRLRHRRDPRGGRGAHHAQGRGDGPGAPRAHREDARAGARRQPRRPLLRRRDHVRTVITTTRRDHP